MYFSIPLPPLSWVDVSLVGVSASGDKNGHQQLYASILWLGNFYPIVPANFPGLTLFGLVWFISLWMSCCVSNGQASPEACRFPRHMNWEWVRCSKESWDAVAHRKGHEYWEEKTNVHHPFLFSSLEGLRLKYSTICEQKPHNAIQHIYVALLISFLWLSNYE